MHGFWWLISQILCSATQAYRYFVGTHVKAIWVPSLIRLVQMTGNGSYIMEHQSLIFISTCGGKVNWPLQKHWRMKTYKPWLNWVPLRAFGGSDMRQWEEVLCQQDLLYQIHVQMANLSLYQEVQTPVLTKMWDLKIPMKIKVFIWQVFAW